MHLSVADLEVLAEVRRLKWFSLKTVTADADLPIDGSEAYLIPVVGTDGLFRPGPGLQRAADTDGPFETHLWNCTRGIAA